MEAGRWGIRMQSGRVRLGGSEMSRSEKAMLGSIPLLDVAGEGRLRACR